MITPRRTRLFRVPGLRAFQQAIRVTSAHADVSQLRDCVVIVPSGAAADQLRRTFENDALQEGPPELQRRRKLYATTSAKATVVHRSFTRRWKTEAGHPRRGAGHAAGGVRLQADLFDGDRALIFPQILTRAGLYDALHRRLPSPPARLTQLEREVLLSAAAAEAEPPFRLRAGLLVEMLAFYDELRRRNQSIERFGRLATAELSRDAGDRGAARLVQQTRFLAAAFRGYEARVAASGSVDEHALRRLLLETEPARPLQQIVVTVGDQAGDADGLWPADFDLLARLPQLKHIDIIATHAALAAGLHERIQELLPGIEDTGSENGVVPLFSSAGDGLGEKRGTTPFSDPVLLAPEEALSFSSRDREEELAGIARRLKQVPRTETLDRVAVIFRRPLPYVYLAREVFADAGIPHQTFDALPLAAEPYAAALDLIFECVTSGFTRLATTGLLGSAHFRFEDEGRRVGRLDVAALDRVLGDARYLGGRAGLESFTRDPSRAARSARAAVKAVDELASLGADERPSVQLSALLKFLAEHDEVPAARDPLRERHLRARSAIHAAIHALHRAHLRFDDRPRPFADLAAMIRRWMEGQTFAPRSGALGVQLLDAQAARYGDFDEVHLVGLVEGEWPQRMARSIFYPYAVLDRLGWPDPRARLAGERAAFQDLLKLPRQRVAVSTFRLEQDTIVGASVFLEDLDGLSLQIVRESEPSPQRIFLHEALTESPVEPGAMTGEAAEWLQLRLSRRDPADPMFHGSAGPREPEIYAVQKLERYLQCPFRYFAERVLRLKEEMEEEPTLTPQARGVFMHSVFQSFFSEWSRRGHGAITLEKLPEARAVFRDVLEPLLGDLSDAEAAVERTRLIGSAADEGLAEAVFRLEAEWQTPVLERFLEYPLEGEFEIEYDGGSRKVALRGIADRIDLLSDGTFRVIDYKLGRAPDRNIALQLPIYAICTAQQLRVSTGTLWEASEAGYIAFGERRRRFASILSRGDAETTMREAQGRLLDAIDGIRRGEFPPRPTDISICTRCAYFGVCRKDYVGDI